MKKTLFILATLLIATSGNAKAETDFPSLCSTVTYRAFGEPPKTVKDCYDKNTELFFLNATYNGYRLPSLGLGLNIPEWDQEINGNEKKTFVGQIIKNQGIYTVRVQIELNGKNIIASSVVPLGEMKEIVVNGDKIQLSLVKQKI